MASTWGDDRRQECRRAWGRSCYTQSFRPHSWPRPLKKWRPSSTGSKRLPHGKWRAAIREAIGMANQSADRSLGRFEVKATASDHFSWLRTRLSIERTMMSWVRTATALIAFGFTIVQFFDRLQQMPGVARAPFPDAPRYLGLSLILCGVAALVIAIWEYHWGLRYLWGGNFALIAGVTRSGKQTPLLAVAIVLAFIGVFTFFAVALRLV